MDEVVVIEIPVTPVVLEIPSTSPVVVDFAASTLVLEVPITEPLVLEVGVPGPQGPPGDSVDPVFVIKPDATLTYSAGQLTRVDYADGTYKDLTYTGGKLTKVEGVNLAGETVTKTLGYTGDELTSVTTVVTPP